MSNYQREIEQKPAKLIPLTVDITDLTQWLEEQAKANGFVYLLAHADDGVIWGRIDESGKLRTSYESLHQAKGKYEWDAPRIEAAKKTLPALQLATLQQARLFCKTGELLIWKDGDGKWQGRIIQDVQNGEAATWVEAFDEPQLLWGTHGTHLENGFTLLEDGAQGLRHAVPMKLTLKTGEGEFGKTTPPKLVVRHYLNKEGFTRVVASRLVGLQ